MSLLQFAQRRQRLQHQGGTEPQAARQLQPDLSTDQSGAVGASNLDRREHSVGVALSESAQIDAENRARLAAMGLDEVLLATLCPPILRMCPPRRERGRFRGSCQFLERRQLVCIERCVLTLEALS